ncbi:MAG: hypothetical protein DRJ38_01395 [Thermoprotei archaeon]|nr:MAG: hypothetical protein DRJ38_01395 [Thermoprotei archaeon]
MDISEKLEKGYEIAQWRDDPWSPEGRKRYESALKKFGKLSQHPWLTELTSSDKVSILDLGAGRGIGGVALAKVLANKGLEVELTMVDLRESAVRDSLKFAKEKGVKAKAYKMDAVEAYRLGRFDLVLMYGAILAHFDSWALPRLFASAAEALEEKGVVVVEEMDRVHVIFMSKFKEFIVENPKPEALSISVHAGYDPVKGSYLRNYIRVKDWEVVTLPVNFRSISTIASTLWLFLKDIDIVKTETENLYLVLGKTPRRLLKPEHLEEPTVVKRGKPWNFL